MPLIQQLLIYVCRYFGGILTLAMDVIPYEVGAYYIFDRGYVDYSRLYKITALDSYFVIRSKKNLQFDIETYLPVNEKTGILSDQIGVLKGLNTSKDYPKRLRKVAFYDMEMNRTFIYLTNNFELSAEQIAMLCNHSVKCILCGLFSSSTFGAKKLCQESNAHNLNGFL